MTDRPGACADARARDWASDGRVFALLWGAPGAAMLAALLLDAPYRAAVWTLMLGGMGVACLVNARRCGRTHCRVTGPFLLGMAASVAGYGAGLVPLGPNGWAIPGSATAARFAGLCRGSERLWGTFSSAKPAPQAGSSHESPPENTCGAHDQGRRDAAPARSFGPHRPGATSRRRGASDEISRSDLNLARRRRRSPL